MSMYADSITQPRRLPARYEYVDYPTRRSGEVYMTEPVPLPRRYPPDSDRGARIINRRPNRTREPSPDSDYGAAPRRRALVIRPRSASRVRLLEPASVTVVDPSSSDDDEPRRRRRDHGGGDDTHIRTTSRPGKKMEYALVRKPSRSDKRAAAPVVHDLELKTKPRHRTFQSRRADLENTEALVLVRARSLEREGLTDDSSDDYEDMYGERRRRSRHGGEKRREREIINDGRREIVVARDGRDRDGGTRSAQDSKLYSYGKGLVRADAEDLRLERRARRGAGPDLESVDSSRVGGGLKRASTVTARGQNPRRYRVDDDRFVDPETRIDPRRDSAYFTDTERRAKDGQWRAIEREKRAIEREKAVLDREQLLIDQEKRVPPRDLDERRMTAADYLKQGDQLVKDGQKYYKTGQGLVSGVKNFLK